MMNRLFLCLIGLFLAQITVAQTNRWQQQVHYTMDVSLNHETHILSGTQKLVYTNNSPDTLKRVYYHLYWNAFQPNSMMDVRSQELGNIQVGVNRSGQPVMDWDSRVQNRIASLQPDEIGYQRVKSLKLNGRSQKIREEETILVVELDRPILPRSKVTFDMEFEAQVPVQIRRSGRHNKEGIDYSMAQWYPKMCAYDEVGWHPVPYVAREFYGVWGDFDVKITMDSKYVLGGTGYLQNPNKIGHGYQDAGVTVKHTPGSKLTWHFKAPKVHDFVWAADPDYVHHKMQIDGFTTHYLYVENEKTKQTWKRLMEMIPDAYAYLKQRFGAYPYKQYSFIQGGDGGMEYAMATLINGNGNMDALYGVAIHEWVHSWYHGVIATNESDYPWMDEGFTVYAEDYTIHNTVDSLKGKWAMEAAYKGYFDLMKSPFNEPLSTPGDHYSTNFAYRNSAYYKGAVFVEQLGYIIGPQLRDAVLRRYYKDWAYKHPKPFDFIRIAEDMSGLQLDWYLDYFMNSLKSIDYAISDVQGAPSGKTQLTLRRVGGFPMPIDLVVSLKDGSKVAHYIPLHLMFGGKTEFDASYKVVTQPSWKWTHPAYTLVLDLPLSEIASIEIDPSYLMADIDRSNNKLTF